MPLDGSQRLSNTLLDARREHLGVLVQLTVFHAALAQVWGDIYVVAHLDPVLALELNGVHTQLVGDVLHMGFQRELGLGRSVAPVRARDGNVGVDDIAVELLVGAVVRGEATQTADGLNGVGVGSVWAGVPDQPKLLRHQHAVLVHARLVGERLGVPGTRGHKLLGPGELQLDRAARDTREVRRDVLDEHLLLGAKAATDARLDDAHILDVHLDERGQHASGMERHLRGRANNHAFVRVQPRHRDVVLDRHWLHLVHAERLLEHQVGLGKTAFHVAALGLNVVHDVALTIGDVGCVGLVVNDGRTGSHGFEFIENGREHLVGDVNETQCLLGDRGRVGGHRGHPIAYVADLVVEADLVMRVRVGPALTARRVLDSLGVLVVQNRVHSGQRHSGRVVYVDDVGVGVRAAQHLGHQLATLGEVVGECRVALGQLSGLPTTVISGTSRDGMSRGTAEDAMGRASPGST